MSLRKDQLLPDLPVSPRVVSAIRACGLVFAAALTLLGFLGFADGLIQLATRSGPRTVTPPIGPTAALGFALAGGFLLLRRSEKVSRRALAASHAAAVAMVALGLLDILFYPFRWTPFSGLLGVLFAARMAPVTAVLFMASGAALLLIDKEDEDGRRPSQTFFLIIAIFSTVILGASAFGTFAVHPERTYSVITWQTALAFVFLSLSALAARPERGAARLFAADAPGGEVARRLMPAAVLAPLLLCLLLYLGHEMGFYGPGFGLALLTTLNSAFLAGLIWRTAGVLNATDAQRRAGEAKIEELNARLRGAMAETHHRVRNNLQFISALADMQVHPGRESVPAAEVRRICSQVQALAAVHDLLTREAKTDTGADSLRADEVLERLAGLIRMTGDRSVTVHAAPVLITGRQASAIVVIANELIVNALKNSDDEVEVRFEAGPAAARLAVLDRGPGFPEGFDPETDGGTGLELVHQMSVWDLQGELLFGRRPEGGAEVSLRFPLTLPVAPLSYR